jgi:hypothetical protein
MKPIFSGELAIAWYVGVVWQVITTFCLAILGIWLLWAKGVERQFAIRISFIQQTTNIAPAKSPYDVRNVPQ